MPFHFALALDNGVKPAELSETITHLAFYSGGANAMTAVSVAKDVFRERGIKQDQLPLAKEQLLPLNEEAEEKRATGVGNNFGVTMPGLVENTTNLLFRDLWPPSRSCPSRPKPCDSQCAHRGRTGGTSDIPSWPRDGQRVDRIRGGRDRDPHRVLCRMAERLLGGPSGERRFRTSCEMRSHFRATWKHIRL
jgi:hypothetical protein